MAKITTQLPGTIITGSVITKTSELINDGDTATSTYVEFTDIGLVAESNDYNDLTNLPNIPTNLDSLTDVTINSALNNDFLQFDSITSLWKNIQLTGALILSKLGFTPENISNKQNSLLVDGTGLKYPTVDAVNTALSSLSIPDASETVAGKVSVGTQTFGGNKTIVGESATVGNAFTVQNLSHTKILEVENKGRLIQRPVNRSNYVYSLYDIDGSLAFGLYLGGTGALTMEAYDASNVLYFQFSPTALNYFLPSFHVGDNVGVPSAKLSVKSTTQGFLPPRMTTAQKNAITSPAAGLVVFDTTLMKLCVYTTTWETITSI